MILLNTQLYTGLLHTHRLVVIIFLFIYLIKLMLLLANKQENLAKFTKAIKVPEMVVSFLFLGTGIGLLTQIPEIKPMMYVKIGAVLASIPLAVIGFKKQNKVLALLSVVLIVSAYGMAEMLKKVKKVEVASTADVSVDPNAPTYSPIAHGQLVYEAYCVSCHGEEGDLQMAGAKNLKVTQLDQNGIYDIVKNGKGEMQPYGKVLSETELQAVVQYAMTLHE